MELLLKIGVISYTAILFQQLPLHDPGWHDPLPCLGTIFLARLTIERFAFLVPWRLPRTRASSFTSRNTSSSRLWSLAKPSPSVLPPHSQGKWRLVNWETILTTFYDQSSHIRISDSSTLLRIGRNDEEPRDVGWTGLNNFARENL